MEKLVLKTGKQKSENFVGERKQLPNGALEKAAGAIVEQFLYAEMLPILEKLVSQGQLENASSYKIVTHLEKQAVMKDSGAPGELQVKSLSLRSTTANA